MPDMLLKPPGRLLSVEELRAAYLCIIKKHGKKAYSSYWMNRNGYNWLYEQVVRKHKIKWNDFKDKCGFNGILKRDFLSLEDLKEEYKNIVKKHGEAAYNCKWLSENSYSWLYGQLNRNYNIKWTDFRKQCGFNKILHRDNLSLENLKDEYKKVVKKHGEDAYSSSWLNKNNYSWLCQQISKKYKIKWDVFRGQCGFDVKLKYTKREETLKDLIDEYKQIVEKYGEIAYSCNWLIHNGYNWLYEQVFKKHKIKWGDFRKQCGFDNVLQRENLSLKDLKEEYKNIVKEYGEDAYSSNWIRNNGYSWLYSQVSVTYRIKWNNFKIQCGFNNQLKRLNLSLEDLKEEYKNIVKEHGEDAYSCSWLNKNGYGWLHQQIWLKHKLSWDDFKKQCGFNNQLQRLTLSLEDLKEEYKKIVKKYGEKAYSSDWLNKNGYRWIYKQVSQKHKIRWNDFKRQCEFYVVLYRKDLLIEDLIIEYKKVLKEFGEKMYNGRYLKQNGYGWLFAQVCKKHKIPWYRFVQMCKQQIEFQWIN